MSPALLMGVTFEVDHILPRHAGGLTQLANLCLSCPTCNRHKSQRLAARDPLSGQMVLLFHPKHDTWSHHFAWSLDGTICLDALLQGEPRWTPYGIIVRQ